MLQALLDQGWVSSEVRANLKAEGFSNTAQILTLWHSKGASAVP